MKNLIIVQCRFNSSRLPGKALYPIGKWPMLVFLLRRLQCSLSAENFQIVLATTDSFQDDIIARWGLSEEVAVVRGAKHDVLRRYYQCLTSYPSDVVVRVTADNPLTCPDVIKCLVDVIRENNADYVQSMNLPYGAGVDVFSADILRMLQEQVTESDEREHINLHLLRNKKNFQLLSAQLWWSRGKG